MPMATAEFSLVALSIAAGLVVHYGLPAVFRSAVARNLAGTPPVDSEPPLSAETKPPISKELLRTLRERAANLRRLCRILHALGLLAIALAWSLVIIECLHDDTSGSLRRYGVGTLVFGAVLAPALWIALRDSSFSPPASRGALSAIGGALIGMVAYVTLSLLLEGPTPGMLLLMLTQALVAGSALWLLGLAVLSTQGIALARLRLSGHFLRVAVAVLSGSFVLLLIHQHSDHPELTWLLPALAVTGIGAEWFAFRAFVGDAPERSLEILFLRPFAHGSQRAKLLRCLAGNLEFSGRVHLIAGPDTAAMTVDPTTLLAFLLGRLRGVFVRTRHEASSVLRRNASPLMACDGRYPSTVLYTSGDVWKDVVAAMAQRADLIVVDGRDFSANDRGTAFELRLIKELDLTMRTVVLTSDGSDLKRIRELTGYTDGSGPQLLGVQKSDFDQMISAIHAALDATTLRMGVAA